MSKKNDDASAINVNVEEAQLEPYQQISRLCLFFDAKGRGDYQKILSFVPEVKSEVQETEVVVFYRGKIPEDLPERDTLRLFGKKDFNLFRQKRASLKEWLKAYEFDALISFADDNSDKSKRIIEAVSAKIKVGSNFSEPEEYFDISIGKPEEKMGFKEFYDQVKHYISQLNINLNR